MGDLNLDNLKVIEIKKRLKTLGLSVAGNKSELVERLQSALIAEKDTENPNSETEGMQDSSADASPKNLEIVEDDTEDENVKEQDDQNDAVSSPLSVPLKKRALAEAVEEAVKPKKRIVLKRNNFPTPILSSKTEEKKHMEIKAPEDSTGSNSARKIIQFNNDGATESEKALKRAQRFNITSEVVKALSDSTPKKKIEVKVWKSKVETAPTDIEVLKKRAERFGENVSSVMIKMQNEEKLKQRKIKFGEDLKVTTLSTEQERKKNRADRFGIQ